MTATTHVPQPDASHPEKLVVFAHGMESGPWGAKITRLAAAAQDAGWDVLSPDYSSTKDPVARVAMLEALNPQARRLVLVGSSMGGYVSAQACEALQPQGLLLMAPALYFEGYADEPSGIPSVAATVHGLADDVVPVSASKRFAETHRSALHLVHDDHRLVDSLPLIEAVMLHILKAASEH